MPEELVEKVAEAPAVAVDKAIDTSKLAAEAIVNQKPVKKARAFWKLLGPGLTTGASDDDPSGIATYSQTGASYGFQFLWLAPLTFPFMGVVQEMCARIGLVTGRGLAANIRLNFPRWVLYLCTILLFTANVINIGADLGAMAKAAQLIFPEFTFSLAVIGFSLLSLIMQIFTSYEKFARYLKWLALVLIAYILTTFMVNIDWLEVMKGTLIPKVGFEKNQIILLAAILGTTISPYLFFWQTSQEVEEEILDGKTTLEARQVTTEKDVKRMRVDVWSGMFLSNLVMYFIIATCAATLNQAGITNINTAADAAAALKPLAGNQASLIFALGVIGTGLLAVPILAGSASYAISESFGWKQGLYRNLKQAYSFYGVIIIALIIGLGINFFGIDPIKALIFSAVVNAIVAPVVLFLILLLSSSKKIMGERKNGLLTNAFGSIITIVMTITALATIFYFVVD